MELKILLEEFRRICRMENIPAESIERYAKIVVDAWLLVEEAED